MAVNSAARVWSPYKDLLSTVKSAILHKQPDAIQDLEVALRKHKPDFISLLKNPAPNKSHRQAVQKANKDGLPVQGQQTTQVLTTSFIEEALIISDLFELNEYAAVELLLDGENQQSQFPGLKRGLVAVLLYYDGRVALVSALNTLLQARPGLTWAALCSEPDLQNTITKYTDELIGAGLISKILVALQQLSGNEELNKLEQNQAIGNARHRRAVTDKLHELRSVLAECVLSAACQARLGTTDTMHVMRALRQHATLDADGTLDEVSVTLLMSLLYCMDLNYLHHHDFEEAARLMPVLSEGNYVSHVHRELVGTLRGAQWPVGGVHAVLLFAWAVMLRQLSQYSANNAALNECCEQDDRVMDEAIERDVFPFLRSALVAKESFHKDLHFVPQLHRVLTDFLVLMPLKVKECRNRGDETARIIVAHQQEGLEPPTGPRRDFEHLLKLISELYHQLSPHSATLAADYWCPDVARSPGMVISSHSTPDIHISLHKFVRLAGDLLPPPLYIPYIQMLGGLANGPTAAHYTYNLLKANGGQAGGSVSTVSWEHFFSSLGQYYTALRAEAPGNGGHSMHVTSDLAHVYRSAGAGAGGSSTSGVGGARGVISMQEVDGLLAWLELTTVVVTHDEGARIALAENQQWLPLVVLLGLVACPVPPSLKAGLLRCLAAFARNPDLAASMWHAIEHAQMIPTVASSGSQQHSSPGGLQTELEEVEARQEEFPMTRSFLSLVRALTDSPIPAGLGAGYRAPGFQPYLSFLQENVFLKFNTRAYRNPAEKWEVCVGVLEILHKLLSSHQVFREDFQDMVQDTGPGQQEGIVVNKPPGHTLLLHMLNDSPMLKMVLYIIDEATKQFDKCINFPGIRHLERASLLCLRMLESALEKQDPFLSAVRDMGAGVMATSMDKLLLAINPRSGRPDHLVNIAKFVTWGSSLSSHALSAVRILHTVSQGPLVQPKLVGMLSGAEDKAILLHGFVECLEAEADEEEDEDDEQTKEADLTVSTVRNLTRQTILRLLLATLDQPAPNLAHFMLGFNLNKAVSKTNLQDPGVLGSPRTCLHSVLCLLNNGLTEQREAASGVPFRPGCLAACQLGYHLVYRLCANPETTSPTMRYLRSTHDFLQRHLQHVPFTPAPGASQFVVTSLMNQQSWLLKSLAIELRLTSSNRQRSHTQRLMSLMLDDNPTALSQKVQGPDGVYEPDMSQYDTELSLFNTTSQMQYNQAMTGGSSSRRRLLAVLSCLELSEPELTELNLDYLNPTLAKQEQDAHQTVSEHGVVQCDVKKLHATLMAQLNNNPGGNAGHRKLIIQEIGLICQHALERNTYRESVHSKRHALEAWRQVVEIILTACPTDFLAGEHRHNVLLELLQDLLMKVSREDALPELSSSIAGVVLTLMANLCHCFLGEHDPALSAHFSTSLLDSSMILPPPQPANRGEGFGQVTGARTMYASSLQVVLKGLLDFLISSSSGAQRVRANLYGALLYFMQIAQKPKNLDAGQWSGGGGGIGSRLMGKESEYEKLSAENVATLAGYGDNLMDIVVRDACDGHHVCRMLSLACLDAILSMEQRRSVWLSYLSSRGYLQHIIESLAHDDQELQPMLQPQPQPLKALYIFESKMGLLTRVAESASGAHMLLQCGLMARLAECTVFDLRPEADQQAEGFIPTMLKRYRYQILFPVLKLCVAMLTSLGLENVQGSQHVLRFVVSHVDIFHAILHGAGGGGGGASSSSALDLEALQELALTTAVLSRAATQEGESDSLLGESAVIEFRSHLARLQRQMIALLPKYSLSDRMLKQIKALETTGGGIEAVDMRIRVQLSVEEIACNVVAFCRGIVSKSGASVTAPCFRLLFGPSLDVPPGSVGEEPVVAPATAASRPQSLGLLVLVLRQATSLFLTAFEEHKQTQRKIHTVADLGVDEIKELCDGSSSSTAAGTGEKMSAQQRQQIARCRLAQLLYYKQRQLQLFSYIIENALYVLWRHLDFYLVHCVSMEKSTSLFRLTHTQRGIRRLQDSPSFARGGGGYMEEESGAFEQYDDRNNSVGGLSGGVSKEQLDTLKQTVCHVINDCLLTRLTDIEQCYSRDRTRYGFMEALIRRIKRLLRLHTV